MSPKPELSDLTALLNRMQRGDQPAGEQAVAMVYDELHRIASRALRGERPGHLLQTTALINEAYARMVGSKSLEIQNRGHFFAIVSQQMRRVLVDYARAQNAQRRGSGGIALSLSDIDGGRQPGTTPRGVDLLLLDEALRDLQDVHPRAAQIVELRYFGGYTDHEVAEAVGVSFGTVRRDWEFARAWLFNRMHGQKKS